MLSIDTQHSVKYRASHPVNSGFWGANIGKNKGKMRMIDKKKDATYDVTHIVWTIFFIFYSFSAIEHRSQHSLFEDMSFNMFVAACIMAGHYFQWRYVSIIPFLALPITMNVFFNALSNHFGHLMGYIFNSDVDIWKYGIPPYIALVVLMFNAFLIASVFSMEPLNWIRTFKKWRIKRRSDERDGKIEISVERFKTLVEALEALPEGIRGDSARLRLRGFSGLICNVVNDIPELKEYFFATNWKSALYDFLECDFSRWAEHNPKIWGNAYGGHMFNSSKAFGKNHGDALTHDEIIIHLIDVCNRLEQSNTVMPAGKFRRLFLEK